MARIENVQQLRAEISRMEGVCKQQEEKLKEDLQQLKEDLNPFNLLLKTISSFTGIRMNKDDFMKDGIGFGISLFFRRLILKAEKVVEHKVYDIVDTAVEALKKLMMKVVNSEARRSERREEEE